jgi:hypothetical protein
MLAPWILKKNLQLRTTFSLSIYAIVMQLFILRTGNPIFLIEIMDEPDFLSKNNDFWWKFISVGRFFVVAALLITPKQQHGKNQNKNTGLFINCMDFVVVLTKINKKKTVIFFVCLGLGIWCLLAILYVLKLWI